jgi:hypothetical protein
MGRNGFNVGHERFLWKIYRTISSLTLNHDHSKWQSPSFGMKDGHADCWLSIIPDGLVVFEAPEKRNA